MARRAIGGVGAPTMALTRNMEVAMSQANVTLQGADDCRTRLFRIRLRDLLSIGGAPCHSLDIASLLEHEVQRALKSPDLQQRLLPLDIKIVPSTSAEATAPHRVRCKFVAQAGQGDRDACRLTAPMSFAAPDVTKDER